MDHAPFLPLTEGRVTGTRWFQRVHELGTLRVASGRLEASDPFVNLGEAITFRIPPGDYPVRVTVADVSDAQDGTHLREAYLSLVINDGTSVRAEVLTPEGREPAAEGEYYGVPVDAGTVAFADAEAISRCMPPGDLVQRSLRYRPGRLLVQPDGLDASPRTRLRQYRHARRGLWRKRGPMPFRLGRRVLPSGRNFRRGLSTVGCTHRPLGR